LNDKMFPRPIRLKFAAECLGDWPAGQGRQYRAALRCCRDALDGWAPPEKAMRAMIDAAREAHILQ
jgi:hypothetical protein